MGAEVGEELFGGELDEFVVVGDGGAVVEVGKWEFGVDDLEVATVGGFLRVVGRLSGIDEDEDFLADRVDVVLGLIELAVDGVDAVLGDGEIAAAEFFLEVFCQGW